MPTDNHASNSEGLTAPADNAEAVTPSDVTDLTNVSRALYIGGDGDASVVMKDGNAVTLVGLKAGTLLPIRINRVNATGTTATSLVSFY